MTKLCINPTYDYMLADGGAARTAAVALAATKVGTINIMDPVDWWHLQSPYGGASKSVRDAPVNHALMDANNLIPFIQVDMRNIPEHASWMDARIRAAYMSDVSQRLSMYPTCEYCNLSMEINALRDRPDWPNLRLLITEAYGRFKNMYPDVQFGVSLQYEQMLRDGTHTDLKLFDHLDWTGITTYPQMLPEYMDPTAMVVGHYLQVRRYTLNPIVIAEAGYSIDPEFGGTEERQRIFFERLTGDWTKHMNVPLINCQFLRDVPEGETIFHKMGIADRPAWKAFSS